MRNSVSFMIIASLFGVTAAALALAVFINLHKFNKAFDATLNDRFSFVLEDVRDSLEGEMRVGLPLGSLSNAQSVLDKAVKTDPYILSIEAFDREGRTVYSTDRSFLFDIVPASWEQAWRHAAGGEWSVKDRDSVALGLGLRDMLGQPTGSLALRYSTSLHQNTVNKLQAVLMQYAAWLSGGSIVLMFVFVSFMTRPLRAYLSALENAISHLTGKDQAGAPGEAADSHVRGFMDGYRLAERELTKLESGLRRMDEEA